MNTDVSVACEIDFALNVTVTLGTFSELANTDYCIAWATDYGKGLTSGKSNNRGVMCFRLRFSASTFGTLASFDPSPCKLSLSFHKGSQPANSATGHEHCTKELGSVQLNLVEKVKLPLHPSALNATTSSTTLPAIPLVVQNEPHCAFKFLFLATEKQSYREQLLVKVSLESTVRCCRMGNEYYTTQGRCDGSWVLGTLVEAFDLGLDFRASLRPGGGGGSGNGNGSGVPVPSSSNFCAVSKSPTNNLTLSNGNLANSGGKGTIKGRTLLVSSSGKVNANINASEKGLPSQSSEKSDARKILVWNEVPYYSSF
jgi:hypothetical protein